MKISSMYADIVGKIAPKEKVESTAFSDFIRKASSEDKKKLYTSVLTKANEDQKAIIEAAEKLHGRKASCM